MRFGNLKEMLSIIHRNVTEDDWDEVLCIVGDNRKGKSNLMKHIVHWWLEQQYGEVKEEDTEKYIGLDLYSFAKVYGGVKRFDPAVHDEAGDLSSRSTMTKQNKLYSQAYQITAGENLLTILCLPELWDLDPYFRKHRVRHLIHVYERGKFNFWTNKRYKRMVAINSSLPFKNYYMTSPSFTGQFNIYNGVLRKRYDELKADKMRNSREEISKLIKGLQHGTSNLERVHALKDKGFKHREIAEELGLHISTVARYSAMSSPS